MSDFEKRIGLADCYGTVAAVEFTDEDGEGMIAMSLSVGQCQGRGYPTSEAARQIAAALLDAADAMEGAKV